jgi:hypothetical protein
LVTVPFGCPPLPPPVPWGPFPPPTSEEPVLDEFEALPVEVDASCPEAALTGTVAVPADELFGVAVLSSTF